MVPPQARTVRYSNVTVAQFLFKFSEYCGWDFCSCCDAFSNSGNLAASPLKLLYDGCEHRWHSVENSAALSDEHVADSRGLKVTGREYDRGSMGKSCHEASNEPEAVEQWRAAADDILRNQLEVVADVETIVSNVTKKVLVKGRDLIIVGYLCFTMKLTGE